MEINNIDKIIQKEFRNRTIKPSASAWERLSDQLDDHKQQKKKSWFLYIGYAATIALLISLGIFMSSGNGETPIIPDNIVVVQPVDTLLIDKKMNDLEVLDKAIVKNDKEEVKILSERKEKNTGRNIALQRPKIVKKNLFSEKKQLVKPAENTVILPDIVENTVAQVETPIEKAPVDATVQETEMATPVNSGIRINSDYLLYAVTHSKEEVKEYYAKYNINRNDVLKTIQKELDKIQLKVNPTTILADVERDIDEDTFRRNFMRTIRQRVADIATAVASRNN